MSSLLGPIHDDQAPVEPQQQVISVSDRAMAYSLLALGDAYVTGSGYLTQEDRRRSLVSVPITDLGQIEIGYICNPSRVLSELALEYIEWLKIITVWQALFVL